MANYCRECGKKLPFLSKGNLCKECLKTFKSELASIEKEIIVIKDITDQQLDILKKQNKDAIVNLYSRIYKHFEADKEIEDKEIETLQRIQEKIGLTNEEANFNERIRPYAYASIIRNEGKLPTPELQLEGVGQIVFKKNETAHFGDFAILKEIKSVSLKCQLISPKPLEDKQHTPSNRGNKFITCDNSRSNIIEMEYFPSIL